MVWPFRQRDRDRVEPHFAMADEGAGDAVVQGRAREFKRGDRLSWVKGFITGDMLRPAERALGWSMMLNFLLVIIVIECLAAFNALLPLRRDVPYLYGMRDYDRAVVDLKPLQMRGKWLSVVMEAEVVRYVKVRHEVIADLDEMARRWSPSCSESLNPIGYEDSDLLCSYMAMHTEIEEYRRFLDNEVKPVKQFVDEGYSRDVKILQDPIRRGEADDGSVIYEVRFQLKDYRKRQNNAGPSMHGERELVRERPMTALIYIHQFDEQLEVRLRHLNPFGLKVMRYQPSDFQDFSEKKERVR